MREEFLSTSSIIKASAQSPASEERKRAEKFPIPTKGQHRQLPHNTQPTPSLPFFQQIQELITRSTEPMKDNRLPILISKLLGAIQNPLQRSERLGILLELIPQALKRKLTLFLLNIYTRPQSCPPALKKVIEQAAHTVANHALLLLGDFNDALLL
ncbi:hypothetical protein HPB48_022928 [Haemaphysalis longicornis]|uniref:Uncharacterized protein n=1 Tax=Haemaphysalis longicornis TaxID=44386 RepID=A0A9J6GIF6_HAELO|nr:hypothetical protein HPB48_022928 [Haemaphysalis longicornis]